MWGFTGQKKKIVIGGVINFLFVKNELFSVVTIHYHYHPINEVNILYQKHQMNIISESRAFFILSL